MNNSAEYIIGFVRHIRWKAEDQLPAWRVCVIGDLPHDQERSYTGRTVRGKPFAVSHVEADAPLSDCQVLDLTAVDIKPAGQVLSRIRKMPILTVGSGSSFCSAGGQICLHLRDERSQSKQKFEVNLSTMKEAVLEVSARLLTVGSVHAISDNLP
ncbi:MAG: YfiR family protein [Pseudomonadota bacterium]